jgi:hypothetical protein
MQKHTLKNKVAKNLSKNALQKLNKKAIFHQKNRCGRNLKILATSNVLFLPVSRLNPYLGLFPASSVHLLTGRFYLVKDSKMD